MTQKTKTRAKAYYSTETKANKRPLVGQERPPGTHGATDMDKDVANALDVLNSIKEAEKDRLPALTDGYRLHQGECLAVMKTMRTGSVDAVITDPPYGISNDEQDRKIFVAGKMKIFENKWDAELPLDWISEASRVLKDGGSFLCFTDVKKTETLWNAIEKSGIKPLNMFFWKKPNPGVNPGKNFCHAIEAAVFGRKPGKVLHWGGGGSSHNVYECPAVRGPDRIHPTQKPIRLMRHLIKILVDRHGIILDPFMGSATTGIAALAMDCFFEGIELDPDMSVKAKRRIDAASKQRNLFFTDAIESSYIPATEGEDDEGMAPEELEVPDSDPFDILFMEERKKPDPVHPDGQDTNASTGNGDYPTTGDSEQEDGSESTGDSEEGGGYEDRD